MCERLRASPPRSQNAARQLGAAGQTFNGGSYSKAAIVDRGSVNMVRAGFSGRSPVRGRRR
jgi:hypothetical protein